VIEELLEQYITSAGLRRIVAETVVLDFCLGGGLYGYPPSHVISGMVLSVYNGPPSAGTPLQIFTGVDLRSAAVQVDV